MGKENRKLMIQASMALKYDFVLPELSTNF